jgi:RNA polymerase sigma-70 factor (ECF subfamily)
MSSGRVASTGTAFAETPDRALIALYDQLTRLDPSPIVALNRAVAVAEPDGPEVALALVDRRPRTRPNVPT